MLRAIQLLWTRPHREHQQYGDHPAGIPTITVETYRGYELERRIGDQLDIVEYVLRYYGLI